MRERNGDAHGHDVGIRGDGQHDGREDGEHFHGHVELVGKQGIVGLFERLDQLFAVLENVPDADIGADKILEIYLEFGRDKPVVFLDDGFDDGALRFDGAAEVQDIALDDGNLEHHLFFLLGEDLILDIVEILGNMIETRKAGFKQQFEHGVEKVRRGLRQMKPLLAFARLDVVKEFFELIDLVAMRRDKVMLRDDHVELAGVRRSFFHIEHGNVNGEEDAVVVTDGLRLIGRREKFLDRQRMDIEVFLKVEDVVMARLFEVDPADIFVFDDAHLFVFREKFRKQLLYILSIYFFTRLTKRPRRTIVKVC